ncbi:prolyl oligopeptidase family serine peptidase [uncultured Polaribacter sp.]|uniref:carboxylesterase family protein n=1 Tax=uncultured Polaribacter sp. TaxID=174711 RepID=UPI00260C0C1D|nr:prolyl oligopeptidase family serine peptidase [uncultured Polaribacter sp.]
MNTFKKYFSLFLLVFSSTIFFSQGKNSYYHSKVFTSRIDTLQYRIMMPDNFDETKQYPLLLFLHGAAERSNDNKAQLLHGSKFFASKKNRRNFPAIVIFPQCPKESYWANVLIDRTSYPLNIDFPTNYAPTKPMKSVMMLMDDFASKPFVNKNQIYVAGMSMGGMGTFEILYRKPKMFAAAIAICGAGNPKTTVFYAKTTPLWVFHGAKDNVVNFQSSVEMVEGLKKYGGKPIFTLYPNQSHNSWDAAFTEPKLLPWLFSNIKK